MVVFDTPPPQKELGRKTNFGQKLKKSKMFWMAPTTTQNNRGRQFNLSKMKKSSLHFFYLKDSRNWIEKVLDDEKYLSYFLSFHKSTWIEEEKIHSISFAILFGKLPLRKKMNLKSRTTLRWKMTLNQNSFSLNTYFTKNCLFTQKMT